MKKLVISTVILILCTWSFSFAEGPVLNVLIDPIYPDVIKEGDRFTGFDIDIWEAIARDISIDYVYKETKFKNIIPSITDGSGDIGISAFTINYEREKVISFSQPYLDSGISIIVPSGDYNIIKSVFTPEFLTILKYLLIFILLIGNLLWKIEHKDNDTIDRSYLQGSFDSYWFTVVTMTTVGYGYVHVKKNLGRVLAIIIMVVGICMFGIIISHLTSTMTTKKLISNISSLEDLKGKIVATKRDTTSEDILKSIPGISKIILVDDSIEDAYKYVIDGKADAAIFDSPSVINFVKSNKDKGIIAVNGFNKQYYGFVVNKNKQELLKQINVSLLKLRDSGEYEKIYNKWF